MNSVVSPFVFPSPLADGRWYLEESDEDKWLNCSLGTDPGAVSGHGCSPDSWNQTQPWEACCLPGSLSEGSDSCFVSQEKLKPGYLKEIPGRMKLFSVFLGKRCWFAGNKVRGMALGEGELSFFPGSEFGAHSCFVFLQLTYVDFLVYDVLDMHRIFEPKCLDAFPNLRDFISRFEVIRLNPLYLHLSSLSYFP